MIIDLQRRISEVGRIRIGQQVASGKGKRPTKLSTFRLTSPDRNRIQRAAGLYGGQPGEWEAPAGNQWEVITEADALAVIVPPSDMAFSQHYELWSAGGCQRRCDGVNESIGDGPCVCDPAKRECDIHTRLSVMLRDLPGLGVWRLDTQGYYAALELQGAVEVIQMAAGRGQMLPAQLRLEQRMTKRPGQGTRRFAVPVLDIEISPAQLMGSGQRAALSDPGVIAIEAPVGGPPPAATPIDARSPLTPVPETVPERPTSSIAEQASAVRQRRKSSQQPIPQTGLKPRTAAQAAGTEPSDPGPKPDTAQANDSGGPATGAQNTAINRLFKEAAVLDREAKKHVIRTLIGYDITVLTEAEADTVITQLKAWKAADSLTEQVWQIIDPPEPEQAAAEPVEAETIEMVTGPQKTKLAIIRDERYAKTDKGRADWFAWVATQIGREVDSNTDLTKVEAMSLLDLLDPEDSAQPDERN